MDRDEYDRLRMNQRIRDAYMGSALLDNFDPADNYQQLRRAYRGKNYIDSLNKKQKGLVRRLPRNIDDIVDYGEHERVYDDYKQEGMMDCQAQGKKFLGKRDYLKYYPEYPNDQQMCVPKPRRKRRAAPKRGKRKCVKFNKNFDLCPITGRRKAVRKRKAPAKKRKAPVRRRKAAPKKKKCIPISSAYNLCPIPRKAKKGKGLIDYYGYGLNDYYGYDGRSGSDSE